MDSRFFELERRVSKVLYDSESSFNAVEDSSRVSRANCDRESSAAIMSCVLLKAIVTSLVALTSFSSFESSTCCLRLYWLGIGDELSVRGSM